MHPTPLSYISVKSILPRIYNNLQDTQLDTDLIIEWASEAYKSFNSIAKFENAVCLLRVENGTCQLPPQLRIINQIFCKSDTNVTTNTVEQIQDILNIDPNTFTQTIENSLNGFNKVWSPMRLSSSNFAPGIQQFPHNSCVNLNIDNKFRYTLTYPRTLVTNMDCGLILISYKKYITDSEGLFMIPDEPEEIKSCLYHYVMSKYWESRVAKSPQLARAERTYHSEKYNLYKTKSIGYLNMPNLDQLENIKNQRNRLVPRDNQYATGFANLSNRESLNGV